MQSINRFLYGPTAEEKVKAWQNKLRGEQRHLDREMRQVGSRQHIYSTLWLILAQLDLATNKVKGTLKQLATKGDVKSAKILAREVVRSNKQKDRLSVSKARLGSINNQLAQQLGASSVTVLLPRSDAWPLSDDESDRRVAEIDRNNETLQLTH